LREKEWGLASDSGAKSMERGCGGGRVDKQRPRRMGERD
jgi:hypothetical protein